MNWRNWHKTSPAKGGGRDGAPGDPLWFGRTTEMVRLALLLALGLVGGTLVGCDDDDGAGSTLDAMRRLVGTASDIDYEPLRTPAEAVQASDVIVLGEVVGSSVATHVADAAGDRETRYLVLTVAVRTVLAGVLPEPAGSVVYVALRMAGIDPAVEIEEAVPKVQTLLVLDDRSDWAPGGALKDFPERFYEPFTDGAWFETGDTFEGLWVDRDELQERWGASFGSLDELAALLEASANQ